MFIFRYGSPVNIGESPEHINAVVLGVSMSGNEYGKVNYLCSWWDGKAHKEEWLDCTLVEPCDETPDMLDVKMFGYGNDRS